jgi:thiol-disulfide isomerase/thioredoxin
MMQQQKAFTCIGKHILTTLKFVISDQTRNSNAKRTTFGRIIMAKTPSLMLPLGTIAPSFYLKDVLSDEIVSLETSHRPLATVIMFICNHCPYVKHANEGIVALANDYQSKNIRFIAINANDVNQFPDDAPEEMKRVGREVGYTFPYLYDITQEVAKAYQAACTPDFYIFDANLSLVYRGQMDDSRPGNTIPVTGKSIREALDCIIAQRPVSKIQKPSLGCNIKWKEPLMKLKK